MSDALTDWLYEALAPLGLVRIRAMFGGSGVAIDGFSVGLIADSMLYLKVDQQTKALFEKRNLEPFVYIKNGKPYTMSYYQAPPELYDDGEAARTWVELALGAAKRGHKAKSARKARSA
jgi:DNA transformation protein